MESNAIRNFPVSDISSLGWKYWLVLSLSSVIGTPQLKQSKTVMLLLEWYRECNVKLNKDYIVSNWPRWCPADTKRCCPDQTSREKQWPTVHGEPMLPHILMIFFVSDWPIILEDRVFFPQGSQKATNRKSTLQSQEDRHWEELEKLCSGKIWKQECILNKQVNVISAILLVPNKPKKYWPAMIFLTALGLRLLWIFRILGGTT